MQGALRVTYPGNNIKDPVTDPRPLLRMRTRGLMSTRGLINAVQVGWHNESLNFITK